MTRRAAHGVGAVALLAATAAMAACSAGDARSGPTTTYVPLAGRVVVVGDSLMVGTGTNLAKLAERHGFDLETSAVPGRQIPESLDAVRDLAPGADVLVVGLGTNDANQPDVDGTEAARRIDDLLAAAPPDVPLLWVNVYLPPGTAAGEAAEVFNEALDEAAAGDRRVQVLDWNAYVMAHPDVMAPDGVHQTVDGYVERSRWLRDALVPLLTPPTSTTG